VDQCKALFEKMIKLGGSRPLAQPRRQWSSQLDDLAQTYPNFQQVVDYLRAEFTLRKTARKPLGFAPFAVHGAAGIGKSVFLESLRALLKCDFQRVQAETSQHAACIVGTAKHWGNSEVGAVFERLVMGSNANPLIYVDEIDKTDGSAGSLTSALYGLLEPKSAKSFADTSQPDITLDASHIQWVFSANDIRYVPGPIRSRWVEFKIPPMKPAEARRVVQSIYAKLLKEYSVNGLEPLSDGDLDALSSRSPREMLSLLRQSIAKAILDKSSKLEVGVHLKDSTSNADDVEQKERWIVVSDSDYKSLVDESRLLH
jgi:ATP-dependent Lon protease